MDTGAESPDGSRVLQKLINNTISEDMLTGSSRTCGLIRRSVEWIQIAQKRNLDVLIPPAKYIFSRNKKCVFIYFFLGAWFPGMTSPCTGLSNCKKRKHKLTLLNRQHFVQLSLCRPTARKVFEAAVTPALLNGSKTQFPPNVTCISKQLNKLLKCSLDVRNDSVKDLRFADSGPSPARHSSEARMLQMLQASALEDPGR